MCGRIGVSARAQDPVRWSEHYKVVAENERVRVLTVTVPKGDKSKMPNITTLRVF